MIILQLFITFFLIGLFTFGGGYAMIPMITNEVVEKYHWISEETLTNFIAISEVTPGPFAINIATFIGNEVGGVLGAIVATIGVILPAFIIILIIAALLKAVMKNRFVKGALNNVIPVVIALILVSAISLFIKRMFFTGEMFTSDFLFDRASFAIFLILLAAILIYKFLHKKSLNPLIILLISGLLGLIAFI